jgi:hypothetical protein
MLAKFPADMGGEASKPAGNHRFEVSESTADILLDHEKADLFYHHVAKLLFLCKRARPDIQTPISLLCTRVKCPDTDDYKKLT